MTARSVLLSTIAATFLVATPALCDHQRGGSRGGEGQRSGQSSAPSLPASGGWRGSPQGTGHNFPPTSQPSNAGQTRGRDWRGNGDIGRTVPDHPSVTPEHARDWQHPLPGSTFSRGPLPQGARRNLPPLSHNWRGDYHPYDRDHWRSGHWWRGRRWNHWGWWWIIGPDWYFYSVPVYPYPDIYTPPGEEAGWWYWCDYYQQYYPYVTYCPTGWVRVPQQY